MTVHLSGFLSYPPDSLEIHKEQAEGLEMLLVQLLQLSPNSRHVVFREILEQLSRTLFVNGLLEEGDYLKKQSTSYTFWYPY